MWKIALTLFVAQVGLITVEFFKNHFGESSISWLELPLFFTVIVGIAFLIAILIHQDTVSGGYQDWLVRPIKRHDLLSAKLLFIILAVQLPMFAVHLSQSVLLGFPFFQSASLAFSKNVYMLVVFTVPFVAFSSLSKDLTQLASSALLVLACLAVMTLISIPITGGGRSPTGLSGISWVASTAQTAIIFLLSIFVIGIQYFKTKKIPFLIVPPVIAVIFLIPQYLPWKSAFSVQELFSLTPEITNAISVEFAPYSGRLESESRQNFNQVNMAILEARSQLRGSQQEVTQYIEYFAQSASTVSLPLTVSQLPSGMLVTDRSELRLMSLDSNTIYYRGDGERIEILQQDLGDVELYQDLRIPQEVFNKVRGKQIRLEIVFSFTLFEYISTFQMAALGDEKRSQSMGWCQTRVSDDATAIQFGCKQVGPPPMCGALSLQNISFDLYNPEMIICYPNYAPFTSHHIYNATTVTHFGVNVPFYDPSGLTKYPVESNNLSESSIVFKVYRPSSHFTKQLTIEGIQLENWMPLMKIDD